MQTVITRTIGALAAGAILLFTTHAYSQSNENADKAAHKAHDHAEQHKADDIYKGIFKDDQIKARTLTDWAGNWKSVYPYLKDGTLDPVIEQKAAGGDKTAEEYRAYFDTGFRTEVNRIVIDGDSVTFHEGSKSIKGTYAGDGYKILTYKSGNRGVRYIFTKTAGDADAPLSIQFSDHRIAPASSEHYHLYWGNDRAALLEEVTHWPTYFPSTMDGKEIAHHLMAK